MTNVVMIILR